MTLLVRVTSETMATKGGIKVRMTEQQIRKIFEEADRDGDGILRKEDLKFAFNKLGSHFPSWRAFRGLHYADNDKDGVLNEEEVDNIIKYAIHKYGYHVGN